MAQDIIKSMLDTIRKSNESSKKKMVGNLDEKVDMTGKDNFLTEATVLMEEAETANQHSSSVVIGKNTPQFGDIKKTQEGMIVKTIGDQVNFKEDSLVFYPDANDITINGTLPSLNSTFQFRFNDASGEGVYLFADGLQLTEANTRIIGKLRDAYLNWRNSLIEDSGLIDSLKKSLER